MNKKICIAGFFISILIVAQLSTAATFTTDNQLKNEDITNDYAIRLTDNERNRLETSIENISNFSLKTQMHSLVAVAMDDENTINTSVIQELLDLLSEYTPTNPDEIYDLMDLIEAIIEIITTHLLELPLLIVQALLYDVIMIAEKTVEIVQDVVAIITFKSLGDLFSAVTSLFSDFNRLIYHVRQLPTNMDELKIYVEERITACLTLVLEEITTEVTTVVWEFSEPRLGYVSKFGVELYDTLLISEELYDHLTYKLEHFKVIFIELPLSYLEFKNADEDHMIPTLINFSVAIFDAIGSAQTLLYDFMDNETEVIDDVTELIDHLTYLNSYYGSEPWNQPITINGTVVNAGSNTVQISFLDEQQVDEVTVSGENTSFVLSFDPSITENPYVLHSFTLVASTSEETLEFPRSSFSDGWVDIKIDFDDDESFNTGIYSWFDELPMFKTLLSHIQLFFKDYYLTDIFTCLEATS